MKFVHRLCSMIMYLSILAASAPSPDARAQAGSGVGRVEVGEEFVPFSLHTQVGSVVGRVMTSHGTPLPGVNVVAAGTPIGAATAVDGSYRLTHVPAGERTIVASAVGYRREEMHVTVPADGEVRADFVLEEVTLHSGEIVVTAARREQLAGRVAASLSTLSPAELEARNVISLDQALRYVPGVQMAGNQVNIRGSSGFSYNTGSRVLLLLDGVPMLRPDADGIPHDAIPMHQVERIEVLKGPGSALYGSGALGGVINVITKDFPERPESIVEVFGGAYQPARYEIWRLRWDRGQEARPLGGVTAAHARRLGEAAGFWIHGSFQHDAGHLRLSERRNMQLYTKFGWRPRPDARFDVLTGLARRRSDAFLFWNGARDALNPGRIDFGRAAPGRGSDDNLVNELSLLPSYSQILSPAVSVSAKARLFGVLIQPLDEARRPKPLSTGTVGFRYGGEVQLNYVPAMRRSFTMGLAGDANATRSSFFDRDDALSQPEGAAFVQWDEAVSERVDLSAGGRFDVYRVRAGVVERRISPKLGASWAAGDRVVFRAAYGEGFRVPSVAERFINNRDYLPVVANLDLRPEISRSYEVGIRTYPRLAYGGRDLVSGVVDAAVFRSDYRRLIEPTFVPREQAFQFVNLTRARIRGAELTADLATAGEEISVKGGYTYLDAEDLSSRQPLVFRSKHLVVIGMTARIRRVEVGADYRYASEPERVDSDFALFIRDARLMVPTHVVDVRIGVSWRSVRSTLHVKNALDYYYLERPALLAPRRHVMLQLSARM